MAANCSNQPRPVLSASAHSPSCSTNVAVARGPPCSFRSRPSARDSRYPSSAAGTARSRSAIAVQSFSVCAGCHREHLPDRMGDGAQVADGTQALVGLVHGEFGAQPFPQEACAAAFDVTVRAGQPLGLVQPGQRPARQLRGRLLARG